MRFSLHSARVAGGLAGRLSAVIAMLCLGAFSLPSRAQQCSAFDFEFVGTSPPITDSNAVLFLHVRDRALRFTATDLQGDTDTGEVSPLQFTCFKDGRVASCSTLFVDRVTFTLMRSGDTVQGDVLLAGYNRAVVDLVRSGSRRIRYLLTPCACSAGDGSQPLAAAAQTAAPTPAPLRPATPLARSAAAAPVDAFYVWRIATPDVSAARAVELAQQIFGFSGTVTETPGTFSIREASDPGRSLVLYKVSGIMEFVDTSKYQAASYTPSLPDDSTGITLARKFLLAHGLLPPNAMAETRVETVSSGGGSDAPNALAISFEARLPVDASVLAAVREGTVVVWLGDAGEVIRLHKNYREVDAVPISVAHKSIDGANAELATKVRTLSGLQVQPVYVAFDPEVEQNYLDPVFEATDDEGVAAARVRGTTFTPILALLGPDPSLQVPSTGGTQLRASASEGTPPYSFFWQSNLDGPLGQGDSLPVQLSPGQHRIDLTVRDANGAGIGGSLLLSVAPAQTGTPAPQAVALLAGAEPVASNTRIDVSNGVSFTVVSQETRPIVLNSVDKGGIRRARNIYFDQFWYEIDVFIAGPTFYTLKSTKCVARKTGAVDACNSPRQPFAQSKGTTTLIHDGNKATISTSARIDNLPGTFKLDFEYAGVNEFCGPEPGFFKGIGLWLATVGGGLAYPLGGQCAGLRPTVKWTYQPPCDKSISGADIQAFCAQDGSACNIPAATLAGLDKTKRYFMREFRAKLSTAVQPPLGSGNDVSSFVKDGNDEATLAATDGAINRELQPFWAPGDGFVYIEAIASERNAVASNMSTRGARDNVHIKKGVSIGIYFPGCNNPRFKGADQLPCIHLHENWLNMTPGVNQTYSKGQRVIWYDVILRAGAEESPNHPSSITNGEVLSKVVAGNTLGVAEQALWVESVTASKDCAPPGAFGGLDNTGRPCVVFPQGVFFTPR